MGIAAPNTIHNSFSILPINPRVPSATPNILFPHCSAGCASPPLCDKVVAWVASVILAIPYICAQYHSSIIALACYMSMAILRRHWGKQ